MGEVVSINGARLERMQRNLTSKEKCGTVRSSAVVADRQDVEARVIRMRSSLARIQDLMDQLRNGATDDS